MANSFRTSQKRKLDFACNDLSRCMLHIVEVSDVYVEKHKNISDPLDQIKDICFNLFMLIKDVNSKI